MQGATINLDVNFIDSSYHPPQGVDIYQDNLTAFALLILFYVLVVAGFYMRSKTRLLMNRASLPQSMENFDLSLIFIFGAMSLGALALYTWSYGGYMRALGLSNFLRQGTAEISTFSFVKPLFYSGIVASILIANRVDRFFSKWSLLLVIFLVTTIASFALISGRANIVLLFLFVGFALTRGTIKLIPAAIFSALFYVVMVYGDALFALTYYLDSSDSFVEMFLGRPHGERSFLGRLVREFQYPYVSFHVSLFAVDLSTLRFGSDFLIGIINILPDRLVGFSPPNSIAYLNTENITGYYSSIIPPGIVGFMMYSGHLVGILVGGLLFGWIGGTLNALFLKMSESSNWFNALYMYCGYAWSAFVLSGEPRVDTTAFFVLYLALFAILFRAFILPTMIFHPASE